MEGLPAGTVTFLFTDIDGSTSLARSLGSGWPEVLAAHHEILAADIREHRGVLIRTEGDGVFAVFASAADGVAAAAAAQKSLKKHSWPDGLTVPVRMGLHTGEGTLGGEDYVGLDVHRAARIAAAGHGGQVLVSDSTRAVVDQSLPDGVELVSLGKHRLKDFDEPRNIYQLAFEGIPTDLPPLRTLEVPSNLPVPLTSFVGRAGELDQITKLLESARLVTLTGPGGTGKTRLALRAASEVKDGFADGVFFVELAPITDPRLVPSVIGSTLGLGKEGPDPELETLKTGLRDRSTLLVLDNFEQIIQAAQIVGELLAACSRLKTIVTSREPLRIAGEHEFPVPALSLPDGRVRVHVDELRAVDSVALFLQRASAVRPGFGLTAGNAAAVSEICARLDGLPLALELAAARVRLFEPADLLARLERTLSFLSGGRDVSERQRTLRGAINWSYDLLSVPEQIIFRRLSVFAGGCDLEAAEAVCLPGEVSVDLLDSITSLHDKSLLRRAETTSGGLRVAMLQTIREYAGERLEASGEARDARKRHASFYLNLAKRAEPGLEGPDQQRWLATLDPELDNFRAVIGWAIEAGETDIGIEIAASLNRFWLIRNHVKEGRRHVEDLLAIPASRGGEAIRAAGLGAAADLAGWQGDYEASQRLAEEALEAYRKLEDWTGAGDQLINMGYAATTADPVRALDLFAQGMEAYGRAGGSPRMGQALIGMALPEMQFRRIEQARRHLEEALARFQQAGDEALVLIASGLLGVCARLDGDFSEARKRYVDVLVRADRVGAHMSLTLPLSALADLALLEGDAERAAILDAAQSQLAEQLGGTPSFKLMGIPEVAGRARAELGDDLYEHAANRGRSTPLHEIVRLALSGH